VGTSLISFHSGLRVWVRDVGTEAYAYIKFLWALREAVEEAAAFQPCPRMA
jgi:hypothetical protein